MTVSTLLLAAVLSQSYARSRVNDADPTSPCLLWKENSVITFVQSTQGNAEIAGDAEFVAVAKSYATWQAQMDACGSLTLKEGLRTASREASYVEGGPNENAVLFRDRRCTDLASSTDACWADDDCGNKYDCWQFSAAAIALTTTSYNRYSGVIYDSDIELNLPSYIFTVVDSPPCVPPNFNQACVATDVQNTVTHEVGHLLGLTHIGSPTSTMNPRADPGETSKRTLDPGSKQFVCDVYPKGRASQQCLIKAFDGEVGPPPKQGCVAAPGGQLAFSALLLLMLRRRR